MSGYAEGENSNYYAKIHTTTYVQEAWNTSGDEQ